MDKKCIVEDCIYVYKKQSARRGYCSKHYLEYRATVVTHTVADRKRPRPAVIDGSTARIPLGIGAKDGYAIVDIEDVALEAQKWGLSKTGYAVGTSSKLKMHRVILECAADEIVDHINHDTLDNRRSNLRKVTHKQNMMNVRPRSANGYKGVSSIAGTNKVWRAYIKPNGKQISLGLYETKEEAAKAYDKAAKEYFGEYAYLNFP